MGDSGNKDLGSMLEWSRNSVAYCKHDTLVFNITPRILEET